MSRFVALAAFAAFFATLAAPAPAAVAQESDAGLIASAEKSIAAGKHDLAVQQLSRALRSEALSSAQVAQAFYKRGLAHGALGHHAQAIADFTNALWIKELPASVLKEVEDNRAQAYAALGQAGRSATAVARAPDPAAAAVGSFETRVEPSEAPKKPSRGTDTQVAAAARTPEPARAFETRVEAAPPQARTAPESMPQFRTSVVAEKAPPAAEPATTAAIPQRAQPSAPPPSASWSAAVASEQPVQAAAAASPAEEPQEQGSRVGRFFSNLRGSFFGDETTETASAAQGEPTGNTTAAAVPTGQWSANTTVGAGQGEGASGGGRNYRLQLASVRSEEDAQAVWQRISTKHQDLVDGREPTIEKTDLGSLGTVYRVQIGPFTDKRESLQLCNAFKAGGVDCFLVTH